LTSKNLRLFDLEDSNLNGLSNQIKSKKSKKLPNTELEQIEETRVKSFINDRL